jgi:hypothetical protein
MEVGEVMEIKWETRSPGHVYHAYITRTETAAEWLSVARETERERTAPGQGDGGSDWHDKPGAPVTWEWHWFGPEKNPDYRTLGRGSFPYQVHAQGEEPTRAKAKAAAVEAYKAGRPAS